MSKVIAIDYQGKYQSATETYFNQEPPVTVNATRFTPVDLLAAAYGSCLMATVDFATKKAGFKAGVVRSEVAYEMAADGLSVGAYTIKIFFNEAHTDAQKETIEAATQELCHVGNTINPAITKTIELVYES